MPGVSQTQHYRTAYEIKVRGKLDESWSHWFSGFSISFTRIGPDDDITTLKGKVADQPALRGILTRLWDFNFEVISVQQISKVLETEKQNE